MSRQPVRANPPICCLCDRLLYGGGWYYVRLEDGRPAHAGCAENVASDFTAQPKSEGGQEP